MISVKDSGVKPATGCGKYTIGRSLQPRIFASALLILINSVVQIVTVGIPFASSFTESWTLHDEHDPQSPTAATTASHSLAICVSNSFGAAFDAAGLVYHLN